MTSTRWLDDFGELVAIVREVARRLPERERRVLMHRIIEAVYEVGDEIGFWRQQRKTHTLH